MKCIWMIIVAMFISGLSIGQNRVDTTNLKDYYLQKSKNQKTAGWVLLGGGTVLAVSGIVLGPVPQIPTIYSVQERWQALPSRELELLLIW